MVLPVIEHRLTKINHINRRRFILVSFFCSTAACIANLISSSTNNWLYTSEVLRYYLPPNKTTESSYDDSNAMKPTFFKNATLGPWLFCWLDPTTEFHCNPIDYFNSEDPADVTSSIQQSLRKCIIFMLLGIVLDVGGFLCITVCVMRSKPYRTLLFSSLTHIFAGITNFQCIIVYMSSVSKEVGNKIYPISEMDDPLFHYTYGYSFICLKSSFLLTELAALFSVLVYMSKRDERTFNRYCMHKIMKNVRNNSDMDELRMAEMYHDHTRMKCLQRASRSNSIDPSLCSSTTHKPVYVLKTNNRQPTEGGDASNNDRSQQSQQSFKLPSTTLLPTAPNVLHF